MQKLLIKNVTLGWAAYLFEPEDFNGDVKYKINVAIPKDHPQIRELKAAIVSEIKEHFTSTEGMTNPLVDCDRSGLSLSYPFLKNCYTIRLYTKKRPYVTDSSGRPVKQEDGIIVPGCMVNVDVTFKAYDFNGNRGISRYLNGVVFVKNGPQPVQTNGLAGIASPAPSPRKAEVDEDDPWAGANNPKFVDEEDDSPWAGMNNQFKEDDGTDADIPF